ncbi:MAG: DUF4097 family beta strand repeat-containing protein [Vicinamibacterales bacterium]
MSHSYRCVRAVALAALVCTPAAACVDINAGNATYVETVEKRFAVTGEPTVTLGTFDGSVDIGTWDRPEVLVVVEKHTVDKVAAERIRVETSQESDRIRVDVREERQRGLSINIGSFSARVTVTVPNRARIEASTGDGRVTIRGVEGDLSVRTGDGSIRIEQARGAVEARSGDGSIDIDGTFSRLSARSGDGRLRVRTSAPSPAEEWSLVTGDGSVLLEVPEGFGAELHAATGDGRIHVDGVAFASSRPDERRVAEGRLGGGGPRVTIRSGDGSITVRRADAPQS